MFPKLLFLLWVVCLIESKTNNVVLILTDDQDTDSALLMEKTSKLKKIGVAFSNAFSTTPVCCPARSSLLTGLYQHNHGVLNNSRSGGCDGSQWQNVHEPNSLGPILQASGYRTFYAGKYLNQYQADRVPPGWDWWAGLKGNSVYYNYTVNVNGTQRHFGDAPEDYFTDVLSGLALEFLKIKDPRPFFMVIAPPAPHEPFTPSNKYKGHFSLFTALRPPNFNTGRANKHWLVRTGTHLPASAVRLVDEAFSSRLETLMSVDDLVADVSNAVPSNTFVLLTSDHGFHLGQFSQAWDKRQPYEADIRVPLILWGPDLPAGATLQHPVLNLDIAPTIFEIAGVSSPNATDGTSFLPLLMSPPGHWDRSFTVEYRGEGGDGSPCFEDNEVKLCSQELACRCFDARNNSFSCVRRLSQNHNTITCQFMDDEHFVETYDMNLDPYQLNNLAVPSVLGV